MYVYPLSSARNRMRPLRWGVPDGHCAAPIFNGMIAIENDLYSGRQLGKF